MDKQQGGDNDASKKTAEIPDLERYLCSGRGNCRTGDGRIADSYSQNLISTAEFFMAFGIALDMMIVAYITHDCVKDREKHYLQMRELRRRHRLQGMKKSA